MTAARAGAPLVAGREDQRPANARKGTLSVSAPAFASASLTGPTRAHNPTCNGHRVRECGRREAQAGPGVRLAGTAGAGDAPGAGPVPSLGGAGGWL
jgi:hypothetical protein